MDSKGWSWMFPPEPHQEPWHGCGCALLPLVPWPGCTPPQGLGGSGSGRRLPQDAPHVPQRTQGPHRAGSRANLYGLWCYAAVGGRRSRGSTAPTPLIPRGSCPFPTAPPGTSDTRRPATCSGLPPAPRGDSSGPHGSTCKAGRQPASHGARHPRVAPGERRSGVSAGGGAGSEQDAWDRHSQEYGDT